MTDIQRHNRAEDIFFEIHRDNPREGPGNFESTRKAYSLLANLPDKPVILDIGCGPGQQTIDLAACTEGYIYALDNHKPYLIALQTKINQSGLAHRIFPQLGDMTSLPFEHGFFDIIWAEGSIYIMGLGRGLSAWRPYLKSRGYIALTEISWLKGNAPQELVNFWQDAYPAIQDENGNISIIQKAGFDLIDHFVLPPNAWWDNYYFHIENKLTVLRWKYPNDSEALDVMDIEQREIELYRKYCDYYGYVFYIMQNQ